MALLHKPSLLAVAIGSLLTTSAHADLFISQYVEGGSYNKAVEIANNGDSSINLDGYSLAKSANGNGSWGATLPLDGHVLAPGEVLVVAHSSASDEIKAVADILNASLANHNGDDPLAILNADSSVLDMVGVMGDVDWGKDVTLVRAEQTPSATFDASQIGRAHV